MGGAKLLLVDDNSLDREKVRRLLGKCDIEIDVTEAQDAASALALCHRDAFDCVLLDYRLPDGDGIELVEKFVGATTAVVMLTGLGNQAVAVEAMKRGAKDYLVKDSLNSRSLMRAIANAMEKQRIEQRLREKEENLVKMGLYDSLTGLPNRNLFSDRLKQCLRSAKREAQQFAVFMMDLDLFKKINDTYGHQAGDQVLQVVGGRLSETLRESDTAARLGGDEFAAILPSTGSLEGTAVLAERIAKSLARPTLVDGRLVEIGVSIGIAVFPDHGTNAESLLRAADAAMYSAKSSGRNFAVSGQGIDTHSPFELLLPKNLEQGLGLGQFIVHYQPKVEFRTGQVVGAEALVRWRHPELGLLPPVQFVPGAERVSLIRPLTMTVLDQALSQAKRWRETGTPRAVAVNLSARLLANKDISSEIHDLLTRHEIAPGTLTLEITENGVMANAALAGHVLRELSDSGIRISIDDFGSGYSSLQSLSELPISELKIDGQCIRRFYKASNGASIVRAIIDLSHGLGMEVVSEGVESSHSWRQLSALGCDFGQGYIVAAPMPADEFDLFCANWGNGTKLGLAASA